jgi:hypothetical protein
MRKLRRLFLSSSYCVSFPLVAEGYTPTDASTLFKLRPNAVVRELSQSLGHLISYQRKLTMYVQGPGDMLGLVSAE